MSGVNYTGRVWTRVCSIVLYYALCANDQAHTDNNTINVKHSVISISWSADSKLHCGKCLAHVFSKHQSEKYRHIKTFFAIFTIYVRLKYVLHAQQGYEVINARNEGMKAT